MTTVRARVVEYVHGEGQESPGKGEGVSRLTFGPLQTYARSPRMSTKDIGDRLELLQGTLDLLILRTLGPGPAHGHAIAQAIARGSADVLQVEQGSLYPALHRLIKRGWIAYEEGLSDHNRRAKFYRLTTRGRRQLGVESHRWDRLARAIARILRPPVGVTPR